MFDVVIKDASLSYAGDPIFSNLNLTLKGGQWTCLLGGSGVGKTSLLRFIAGLGPADHNDKIAVSGTALCQNGGELDNRIAWMAQQDLLLPWFSVLDNVTLGHRLRSSFLSRKAVLAEHVEQAKDILNRVGLADKALELPQNLSGGQRQRVALARTLIEDRPVVLMDEPFASLDAITRLNLQDLAWELLQNQTILLITHDPLEALRLGHEVYHLQGKPAQLTDPIVPPGITPRPLNNSSIMELHGQLLERLRHEEVA